MAKVFIEESTLTAIGDAIRGKEGTSELIPVTDMSNRITNLPSGGGEVEPIELTGVCSYACSGQLAGNYIAKFGNTISTRNISNAINMFYMNSVITQVPFDINFMTNNSSNLNMMFYGCNKLIHLADIDPKTKSGTKITIDQVFSDCYALENAPYIYNAFPSSMKQLFRACRSLRTIPDDYFNSWDMSYLHTYGYANMEAIFQQCYSLRKIPTSFFISLQDWKTYNSYSPYYNFAADCYALDEIIDMPVATATYTSNAFNNTISSCNRLKRFTFKTNDDGTPKTANWKSQTLDFSSYVGYSKYSDAASYVVKYNSGISLDTEMKQLMDANLDLTGETNYQELKNHPDAWTGDLHFSRYNHDSAVETINSLPDTSAYGTNTIKFKGLAGEFTDGGAINTLTEEEIAVATAKGWTVTFA